MSFGVQGVLDAGFYGGIILGFYVIMAPLKPPQFWFPCGFLLP